MLDDGASRHEPHAVGSCSTGVAGTADDEAHFASTYGQSGRTFAQMQPAYDYGRTARSTYGDRDFASAEATMRQEYEGRYGSDGDNAWNTVKDAVRHGYDRAKRAVSQGRPDGTRGDAGAIALGSPRRFWPGGPAKPVGYLGAPPTARI